ncbi:hypothetical protein [Aquincola tertiaricarbonis]|uniref:hypothetical protein n=1 Tax=Aquincola tertiaricarbonis TaxID=391953 RepID=UPI000614E28C|nr:hypothetical protein [Aquincola tertiaricarbonis]
MKVSKLFMGIECNAEATDGSALRGLVPSSVLEEVLGASPSEVGWLQAACAHSEAIRLAIQQEARRRHGVTVVVNERALRRTLKAVDRRGP